VAAILKKCSGHTTSVIQVVSAFKQTLGEPNKRYRAL